MSSTDEFWKFKHGSLKASGARSSSRQAMHRWHSCCHGRRRENPWRLAVEEVPKLARKKLRRSQAFHQEQVRRWNSLLSLAVSCQKIQKSNCRAWKKGNVRGEELSLATLQSGQNTSFSSSITASLVSIESLFVRPSSRTLREEARWSSCELEEQEVGLATVWSFLRTQALIMSCIQRDGPPPRPPWSIAQNFLSTRERPWYCAWDTFGERERERKIQREKDGSDVTIVALKLAMNSHFPLPKIRTIGDELTLSLAKNSHFSFLPSHFPYVSTFTERSLLWPWNSQWVHTFHCQNFFALFVPPLSNGTSRATSDRKPKTNDQILPRPILFFPSKKWIKLIPKTIGNRKRDCAWGGSVW